MFQKLSDIVWCSAMGNPHDLEVSNILPGLEIIDHR